VGTAANGRFGDLGKATEVEEGRGWDVGNEIVSGQVGMWSVGCMWGLGWLGSERNGRHGRDW
jgi:hypothetical protein